MSTATERRILTRFYVGVSSGLNCATPALWMSLAGEKFYLSADQARDLASMLLMVAGPKPKEDQCPTKSQP